MLTYIARRVLFLPLVLLGVTGLVFFATSFLSPYQLVSSYIRSPEELKNQSLDDLVKKYRLDDPASVKYIRWLGMILRGNLGYSRSAGMSVLDAIEARFPATLELALFAVIPVVLGGIWLGSISAVHHNRAADHVTRIFAIVGWSLPTFVFGLIVLMYLYGVLGWFPPGRLSVWANDVVMSQSFVRYTGLNTLDGILNGEWRVTLDALRHLVAPTITLAYLWWAFILRVTRSSMLDVLNREHVRTARAKGLPEALVVRRHVRRNAMIPVVTVAGTMILGLLGGLVVTETVFDYKGIGLLAATAAQQLDYTCVVGITLLYGFMLVVTNLVVDVLYAMIDPRVRLD